MATDYATLTLTARAEARDLVYHNPVTQESLGSNQSGVDGANLVFYLANKNIVSGTVSGVQYGPWISSATLGARSLTGFTVDTLNGIITMAAAPASGAQPPFIDYYFQWFPDADYTTWIDEATQELQQVAGQFSGPVTNGGDLTPALISYVVERFWLNRASQYATKYASSAMGSSEQVQTVTQNYLALAKQARKRGDDQRMAAYIDAGKKAKPASGTITYGMSRYTPRR